MAAKIVIAVPTNTDIESVPAEFEKTAAIVAELPVRDRRSATIPIPNTPPMIEEINPMSADSKKNILMMNLFVAPRHLRVPISLNRSVTLISMAFVMLVKQSNSER